MVVSFYSQLPWIHRYRIKIYGCCFIKKMKKMGFNDSSGSQAGAVFFSRDHWQYLELFLIVTTGRGCH